MSTVTSIDAKDDLDRLIKRALSGEDIVIKSNDGVAVRLQPIDAKQQGRGYGALADELKGVTDDVLFEPLPEAELKRWCGEGG